MKIASKAISFKSTGSSEQNRNVSTPVGNNVPGRAVRTNEHLVSKDGVKSLINNFKASLKIRFTPNAAKEEIFDTLYKMKDEKGAFKFTAEQAENISNSSLGLKRLFKVLKVMEGRTQNLDGNAIEYILTKTSVTPKIAEKTLDLIDEIETNPAFETIKLGLGKNRQKNYEFIFTRNTDFSRLQDNVEIIQLLKREPVGEYANGIAPFDHLKLLQRTQISAPQFKQLKKAGLLERIKSLDNVLFSQDLAEKDLTHNINFINDVITHPDLRQYERSQLVNPYPVLKLKIDKPINLAEKKEAIDFISEIGDSPRYSKMNRLLTNTNKLSFLLQPDFDFNEGIRLFDKISENGCLDGLGSTPREKINYIDKKLTPKLNRIFKKYSIKELDSIFSDVAKYAEGFAPYAIQTLSDNGVNKTKNFLAVLAQIKEHPVLSKAEFDFYAFEDFSEKYLYKIKPDKIKPELEKLALFAEQPQNKEIFKYIGPWSIRKIMSGAEFKPEKFNPEVLESFRKLARNKDTKFILESSPLIYLEQLATEKHLDVKIIEKNAEILAKAVKEGRCEFLTEKGNLNPKLLIYENDLNIILNKLDSVYKKSRQYILSGEDPARNIFKYDLMYKAGDFSISVENGNFETFGGEKHYASFDKHAKQTVTERHVQKVDSMHNATRTVGIMDFRTNTSYTVDQQEIHNFWQVKKIRSETRTPQGKLVSGEIILPSNVDGVYNIKELKGDGKLHTVSYAVNNADGTVIYKDLRSFDGTKSSISYRRTPDLKKSVYSYTITNPKGKILAKRNASSKEINENTFEHVIDSRRYRVTHADDNLKIKSLRSGLLRKIQLKKLLPYNRTEFESVLKKLPADVLIAVKRKIKSIEYTEDIDSCISRKSREMYASADSAIMNHELGHILFNAEGDKSKLFDKFFENLISQSKDKITLSNKKRLMKIFNEEKKAVKENFPSTLKEVLEYFINNSSSVKGADEAAAEAMTIIHEPFFNPKIMQRTHYLQQYFPKTIAFLMKVLRHKIYI